MNSLSQGSSVESVKALTEFEIQQRLYGRYLSPKQKKTSAPSSAVSAPATVTKTVSVQPDPEWTGAEILAGELKNLREELISLRQEKELLEQRIKQRTTVSVVPVSISAPAVRPTPRQSVAWHLIGKVIGGVVLLAAIAYPVGMRILVASPPLIADASPYTVQVAVYDVKSAAQRSSDYLKELGYQAFLMDIPRQDGRSRYRLYVGRFVTKEEADTERARLAADPRFTDSFVRFQ